MRLSSASRPWSESWPAWAFLARSGWPPAAKRVSAGRHRLDHRGLTIWRLLALLDVQAGRMPYAYGPTRPALRTPAAQMTDVILIGTIVLLATYVAVVASYVTL